MKPEDPYAVGARLSCLDLPKMDPTLSLQGPDDLLRALVRGSDGKGRYWASPRLLRCLCWWELADVEDVRRWRDQLVAEGLAVIDLHAAKIGYDGDNHLHPIIQVLHRERYARWKPRRSFPAGLREQVYERDGHQCVACGTGERLTLDHIVPYSHGGPDTFDNLRTLCHSCNSSKGARV